MVDDDDDAGRWKLKDDFDKSNKTVSFGEYREEPKTRAAP
jgi:hypothetical protein